jgi:hypothetical protein
MTAPLHNIHPTQLLASDGVSDGIAALGSAIAAAATSVNNQFFLNAGAPTSGASGTQFGIAVKGAILVDTTNLQVYFNSGTLASPTWTPLGAGAVNALGTKTTAATLKYGVNTVTLTNGDTCVLTHAAAVVGGKEELYATQSAVSSYNGLITHGVLAAAGTLPAMTSGSAKIDWYEYRCSDGSNWFMSSYKQDLH